MLQLQWQQKGLYDKLELIDAWRMLWLVKQVDSVYLSPCVLSLFSPPFLCSSYERNDKPRLLCYYLSLVWANKKHGKQMGSPRKGEFKHFSLSLLSGISSRTMSLLHILCFRTSDTPSPKAPFNTGWSCFLLLLLSGWPSYTWFISSPLPYI